MADNNTSIRIQSTNYKYPGERWNNIYRVVCHLEEKMTCNN